MTLPQRPGVAPPEENLGRREFAVVPWIVAAFVALGLGASEIIRERGGSVDWPIVGIAFSVAVLTALLAAFQERPIGRRLRAATWLYVVGSGAVLAGLAGLAIHNRGVSSVYFTAVLPLAAYVGVVLPPRLRPWTLVALLVSTAGIQIANDQTLLFDAFVMWALILTCWFSGVLVAVGQARVARIARRLASYDRVTGTLNRRGFLRQLELALGPGTEHPDDPIALVLVNLVGFREVNDDDDAAGDELLGWVGTTLPSALPDTAELGRLGNDEFGILLPGATSGQAEAVAQSIHAYLRERIEATVGVATSETRRVAPADLYRIADAARVFARREGLGLHMLVAGSARVAGRRDPATVTESDRPLSYAAIRATGKVPRVIEQSALYGTLIRRALSVVAAAGIIVVVREWLGDAQGFWPDVVRYAGVPWILWNVALAASTRRFSVVKMPRYELFLLVNSSAAIAIGVAATALADGGLTAPIGAGMFVKLIFDAAVVPFRRALLSGAILLSGWAFIALLSPPSMLWVLPFELTLFAGSFALGVIAYRASEETATYAKDLAYIDSLTLLPNRLGFRRQAETAFFHSATETGAPFGVLSFRLSEFKAFSERNGYAAGDSLLCEVAELLTARLPGHYVIGRTGADEFVAAVPVSGTLSAMRLADDLQAEIGAVLGIHATAGHATCPEDAASVAGLLATADVRVEARRSSEAHQRVDTSPRAHLRLPLR